MKKISSIQLLPLTSKRMKTNNSISIRTTLQRLGRASSATSTAVLEPNSSRRNPSAKMMINEDPVSKSSRSPVPSCSTFNWLSHGNGLFFQLYFLLCFGQMNCLQELTSKQEMEHALT